MKREARQGGEVDVEGSEQQQMTMEEVFRMVNSQKKQMWQQERKSEETF